MDRPGSSFPISDSMDGIDIGCLTKLISQLAMELPPPLFKLPFIFHPLSEKLNSGT
jgi:hypothetical protein